MKIYGNSAIDTQMTSNPRCEDFHKIIAISVLESLA